MIYLFGKLSIYSFFCFIISLIYMLHLKFNNDISFIQTPMPLIVLFFIYIDIDNFDWFNCSVSNCKFGEI